MIQLENAYWVANSMDAWEQVNEAFLKREEEFLSFRNYHHALYAYDLVLGIRNPKVDPNFDFGRHFNYTKNKWKALLNNYLDYEELNQIKKEVQEAEQGKNLYNLAMQFTNKHGHGKNCLLSMVFSRRFDTSPTIVVFLRASEITKRLICDLLFFQRIGEYVYGETKFQLVIHFNQLFNDDTVLLMYHVHKDAKVIIKSHPNWETPRGKDLLSTLDKLLKVNPEDVKYKVHRRVAKVLHPELYKYPKTLAKDCTL